ncbi:MAG: hypothetical protein ACI9VS_002545 [Candidatus Binatia bacterium]|jgi:hypothetical protein
MADIYKYQTERAATTLTLVRLAQDSARLRLSCSTDSRLFDQPLTLEIKPPQSWIGKTIKVTDADGNAMALRRGDRSGETLFYFESSPDVHRIQT